MLPFISTASERDGSENSCRNVTKINENDADLPHYPGSFHFQTNLSMDARIAHSPSLPLPLKLPASLIPSKAHTAVMVGILSRLFANSIDKGDMDFLESQSVKVVATDAGVSFAFGMENGKLVTRPVQDSRNLTLAGKVHDFLLLASRREDADTLFFQRRLKMEGDTTWGWRSRISWTEWIRAICGFSARLPAGCGA